MKSSQVTITIFEKGDRVLTPHGLGTVVKDERITSPEHLRDRQVRVLLDEPTSKYQNRKALLSAWSFIFKGRAAPT